MSNRKMDLDCPNRVLLLLEKIHENFDCADWHAHPPPGQMDELTSKKLAETQPSNFPLDLTRFMISALGVRAIPTEDHPRGARQARDDDAVAKIGPRLFLTDERLSRTVAYPCARSL